MASGGSSKMKYIVPLLTAGVGAGGYAGFKNPNLPVIGPAVTWVKNMIATDYTKAGTYEVRVLRLTLRAEDFHQGDKIKLRTVVTKKGEGKKETECWDSTRLGEMQREVGKDPLSGGWVSQPFTVAWKPGETFRIDVFETSGMTSKKMYSADVEPEEGKFPLRGSKKLQKPEGAASEGNSIEFAASQAKEK